MNQKNLFLTATALLGMFVMFSCEKEEEEKKPYAGNWVSRVYPTINAADSSFVLQQMAFNFTNEGFNTKVSQSSSLTDMNLIHIMNFGGNVEEPVSENLKVSIQTIEVLANSLSGDRTQDEAAFNAVFGLSLGKLLEADFTATYKIYSEGDSMLLTLPTVQEVNTTLRLGK
jgi:hypothetical protein